MTFEEQVAAMRAEGDQAREATKEMAQQTAAFYNTLVAEGVPAQPASMITSGYINTLILAYAQQGGESTE